MNNAYLVLLIATAAALIGSAQAASAPPAVRATGKKSSQALHTSTLIRGRTPRRALRASGWQCCAWSQVDMYDHQGKGDHLFDRLSKQPGDDAKPVTASAQAPAKTQEAVESPKELKEKPRSPKFYRQVATDGLCGDAAGPWNDIKCTGTSVCAKVSEPKPDQVTVLDRFVRFNETASEPKDDGVTAEKEAEDGKDTEKGEDGKATEKGVDYDPDQPDTMTMPPSLGESLPTSGELKLRKVEYRCQESS